jgi:protein-S-isoprenylcysteine O-methyltransferase Ste14
MFRAFGWIGALGGLALGLRSALLLAGRGRPQRGPKPAFVIAGPYRQVRNPLFLGILLASAGTAVAADCRGLAVATGLLAVAMHVWLVWVEEPRLRVRFGEAYDAYLVSVPRWVPRRRLPAD